MRLLDKILFFLPKTGKILSNAILGMAVKGTKECIKLVPFQIMFLPFLSQVSISMV